jgi:hypothetical protein
LQKIVRQPDSNLGHSGRILKERQKNVWTRFSGDDTQANLLPFDVANACPGPTGNNAIYKKCILSGNNCCVQNNTNNKKQIKPMPHFT